MVKKKRRSIKKLSRLPQTELPPDTMEHILPGDKSEKTFLAYSMLVHIIPDGL
jgi:hypothetical protein